MRSEDRLQISCLVYLFEGKRLLTRAIMKDASPGGAKLIVGNRGNIPDTVILKFDPQAANYRECLVRWRKDDSVGVLFTAKFDGFRRSDLSPGNKTHRVSDAGQSFALTHNVLIESKG